MNDDSNSSPPAPRPFASSDRDPLIANDVPPENDTEPTVDAPAQAQHAKEGSLAKKLQFMTHLMKSLDILVFAELCTLYYMDCNFFRLYLRAIPQYLFLTPKSDEFLLILPAQRLHVFAIVIPNLLCMLLHSLDPLPQASEITRGYLHGGLIVDFIGQKAPSSKLGLLFLDLVILTLQCLMLAVHIEREKLRRRVLPGYNEETNDVGSGSEAAVVAPPTIQDLDAEERGVRQEDETDDIELRVLSRSSWRRRSQNHDGDGDDDEQRERFGLTDEMDGTATAAARASALDVLWSGNAMIGDFHVAHAIQFASLYNAPGSAYSMRSIGYAAARTRAQLEERRRRRRRRHQQEQELTNA